jgi:hypothetical protein
MEDGGWRIEDGGWRIEDGGWRMERKQSFQDNCVPKCNPPRRAGFGNEAGARG